MFNMEIRREVERARHEEMVRQAKVDRLIAARRAESRGKFRGLREQIGDALIASGVRVKGMKGKYASPAGDVGVTPREPLETTRESTESICV